jgi:hypothetical protein
MPPSAAKGFSSSRRLVRRLEVKPPYTYIFNRAIN